MASKYDIVVPTIGEVAPLKDLFLFELGNLQFLVGKSETIWGTSSYRRAFLLPMIVAAVVLVIGVVLESGVIFESIIIALGILGLGAISCWSPYRDRLLSKEGKLIQGRIIETQEKERKHIGLIGSLIFVRYGGWQFGALCAFRTPDGKVMSTRRYAIRNDLENKVISDGTPIVVLYRNPRHFKIL